MTTTPQMPSPQTPPPSGTGWTPAQPPASRPPAKFGALAWTALILGIVGIVGSPIIFLNNLTAVVAAVGVVLGGIALFGTRKVLAGAGVGLCILAVVFTVMTQDAAVRDLDRAFGDDPAAAADVTVSDCHIVESDYGYSRAQATVMITNSTDVSRSYYATIGVNDSSGARLGEIIVSTSSLAAGQSITFTGDDASGSVTSGAHGPVTCTIADVDRFAS